MAAACEKLRVHWVRSYRRPWEHLADVDGTRLVVLETPKGYVAFTMKRRTGYMGGATKHNTRGSAQEAACRRALKEIEK